MWSRELTGGRLCRISVVDLGHATYATTTQSDVLIAIPPAVDGALDKAAFLAQIGVQLRQRPTDRVALALVVKAVALV